MQKKLIYQIIFSLALLGCQSSQEKAISSDLSVIDKSGSKELKPPKFESTFTSNEIRENCEPIVNEINNSLADLRKIEKKTSFYGVENTPVSIWYSNTNVPVKIECAVPNDSGIFTGAFQFYFIDGKLWYSDQIFAKYLFSADTLQFWLDENWNDNKIPYSELNIRGNEIKDIIGKILTD